MKKLFFTFFLSLLIAFSASAQDQKSTKIRNTSKDPATATVAAKPVTKADGRAAATATTTTNPASAFSDAVSKMETNHAQAKTQAKSTEVPAQPVKKITVAGKTKKS